MGGAGNSRHWLKRARAAGARVSLNAAGETIVRRGELMARICTNRKDAPRSLVTLVRRLEKEATT